MTPFEKSISFWDLNEAFEKHADRESGFTISTLESDPKRLYFFFWQPVGDEEGLMDREDARALACALRRSAQAARQNAVTAPPVAVACIPYDDDGETAAIHVGSRGLHVVMDFRTAFHTPSLELLPPGLPTDEDGLGAGYATVLMPEAACDIADLFTEAVAFAET